MFEVVFTLFVVGLLAGFVLSMPIAGPISIVVTSNALKGRKEFCRQAAIGASIVEFFYVMLVVYGIATFYQYYQQYVPYILCVGAVFICVVAWKIMKTDLSVEDIAVDSTVLQKQEGRKGLRVGMLLNLGNPTLILGWLTSSFVVLSLASSWGLNTGGLDLLLGQQVSNITEDVGVNLHLAQNVPDLILAALYALGVAIGCAVWFILLSRIIIRYRMKIKMMSIGVIIRILGVALFGIGGYLIWKAINLIIY
ncbi:hypothetical protein EYV94_00565 [Puteibacter caeruleilacunae]|nr:hypothetical protein EYV94_00565 [Puteibacter caeruleilacunae]